MADFKLPTADEIASRQFEEQVYEAVLSEVENGTRRSGIWAKALADAEGDDPKARALYLKYRAQAMLDEAWLAAEAEKLAAEAEKNRPKLSKPLLQAAMYGRTSEVRELIEKGADVNYRSSNGSTPLYRAANNGHIEVVRLLLASGADATIKIYAGRTARSAAIRSSHPEIADLLP